VAVLPKKLRNSALPEPEEDLVVGAEYVPDEVEGRFEAVTSAAVAAGVLCPPEAEPDVFLYLEERRVSRLVLPLAPPLPPLS